MPTTVTERELRGADFRVGISAQTAKDAIDENPVFIPVRRREGKTMKAIGYVEDPTVSGDMQALEQIQDTEDLSAELVASFSKQSVDWLIHALHSDSVEATVTDTDIAATATGFTSVGNDFGVYEVGDGIWVSGFLDSDIDGFYIVTAAAAGVITTTPAPAATEVAGESITVTTLRSQNQDLPTYSAIQTRGTDLSQGDDINYHTIYNAVPNTFSMEIGETGIVTSTTAYVAESEVDGFAAIAGQTYASPMTDRAVTSRKGAQSSVQAFYVDDASATCKVKSLSLEVNNNYQKDDAAGCNAFHVRGQFGVTGSVNIRSRISDPFEWRNKSWDGTRAKIAVRVSHGGGDETYIVVNRAVVTEVTMPDGNNVAANTEASIVAENDVTRNHTIEVYRNWGA